MACTALSPTAATRPVYRPCKANALARTTFGIPLPFICCAPGVDINTIRAWLGHVSLDTTYVDAEVDLEMKAKPLSKVDVSDVVSPSVKPETLASLMAFMRGL